MTVKSIQSVRGMHDYLPEHTILWQQVESILKIILDSYGYDEIRFPVVEFTDLFKRSIGEVTDVVEKEMYNFHDLHGNSLTLRPEGTSGCVRAAMEHSLLYNQEQRLWYMGPMFRYERPQKGRYRQFHQFSAEAFGQIGPDIDAEIILITARCWKELGISQYVDLELNSIGILSSRSIYRQKLIKFLEKKMDYLDNNSIRRLYSNPMRILDTKNNEIKKLLMDAPILMDYLDNDSKLHFTELCELLDLAKVSYKINPRLVRGLDYYNRTVFEWVTNHLGSKKTICAGGRYDELVKQLGGDKQIPAIGFAIGLERILLLIQTINNTIFKKNISIDIYIICLKKDIQKHAILLSEYIRKELPSLRLKTHHGSGNIDQQIAQAKKNKSKVIIIIDEFFISTNTILLKNLKLGQQEIVKYNNIIGKLSNIFM